MPTHGIFPPLGLTPMGPESITCPVCGMRSWHPMDVQEGYCGACHAFTGRPCEVTPDMLDGATCPVCGHPAEAHPRLS